MRKAILVLWIAVATQAEAGTTWIHQDNASCLGDRNPEEFCTGVGVGNGDGKWHLDISLSDVKWMQACTARVLARGEVPVCTATRQVSAGLDSCPATEDGNRFPVRLLDFPLIQSGDGTFGGASGIAPDVDFDKWPGGTWSNRPELDSSRAKWRNVGAWSAAWPASDCKSMLKDLARSVIDNSAVRGEGLIDQQELKIGETVPEDP